MSFQIKNCEITLLQEKIEKETETETRNTHRQYCLLSSELRPDHVVL